MASGNPLFKEEVLRRTAVAATGECMTVSGTVDKSFLLLALVIGGALVSWFKPQLGMMLAIPAMVVGLVGVLIAMFKKEWMGVIAPVYSVSQGIVIGIMSLFMEKQFPGIVVQAVGLTFGTLFGLLALYRLRIVRVTDGFRAGVFAATAGIGIVYLVSFVMGFFGKSIPMIHESGIWGIGFSLFVVFVAALNLVLDFDFIERGSESGAPKYMEWYGAFGLMVTLIWLYVEILRLLSKIRSRD